MSLTWAAVAASPCWPPPRSLMAAVRLGPRRPHRQPEHAARRASPAPVARHRESRPSTGPRASPPARAMRRCAILMYHVIAAPPTGARLHGAVGGARSLRAHDAGARARRLPRDDARRRLARLARPRRHAAPSDRRSPSTTATRANRRSRGASSTGSAGPASSISRSTTCGLKGGLARAEVRAMLRDGWEIDAHTLTHPDLTTVDAARLRHEVAGSRRVAAPRVRRARRLLRLSRRAATTRRRGGGARRGLRWARPRPSRARPPAGRSLRAAADPRHAG